MKAIIIGATGATGKELTEILLADPSYTSVKNFVRKPSGLFHPKLEEVITDFDNPEGVAGRIDGDLLFSCLGTTRAAAGSLERQWHVDYEIPARFAELARDNGVSTVVLLSAYNAAANSRVPYSAMKGRLERHLEALEFDRLIIFRPGFLLRKDSDRLGERIVARILQILNKVGLFTTFKPLPTRLLAEKMSRAHYRLGDGKHIIELNKIFTF